MECLNKTISTIELIKTIDSLSASTVLIYLNNFRFSKFRKTYTTGKNAIYELSNEFLNTLYSYLIYKNREDAAQQFRNYFKNFDLNLMSWEDFVCKS